MNKLTRYLLFQLCTLTHVLLIIFFRCTPIDSRASLLFYEQLLTDYCVNCDLVSMCPSQPRTAFDKFLCVHTHSPWWRSIVIGNILEVIVLIAVSICWHDWSIIVQIKRSPIPIREHDHYQPTVNSSLLQTWEKQDT